MILPEAQTGTTSPRRGTKMTKAEEMRKLAKEAEARKDWMTAIDMYGMESLALLQEGYIPESKEIKAIAKKILALGRKS
jgi:hypothetical protein